MKKILCFALVLLMCAALVSCGDDPSGTTEPTQSTTPTTASTLPSSSATDEPDIPVVIDIKNDPVKMDVGENVTVMYNPAYANIETDVKKGVGSKENVTLTLTLNDGYVFDGWSVGNIMANGAKCVSTELTFTYEASESDTGARTMIYPNYSATLIYHANGGTSTTGELFTQTYPVTWYKCPSTLPEQGYFTREGYTLVEYNTKPDGTGYGVSLGSRMPLDDKPSVELYCIWAKQNDASDFDYVANSGSIVIKGYKGTSETVVIPDTIDGKKVTTIHDLGEPETAVKTVILSKNVRTVEDYALVGCSELETLVIFDSLTYITDDSVDTDVVKNLRVNAALNLFSQWHQGQTTYKIDKLVYAVNTNKKVFVIYGGSGALFGFDGSQIDEELGGEYVVVNLGSNVNISSAFYFDWLSDVLDEDDVLLWSPEAGEAVLGRTSLTWYTYALNAGHYDILRYVDATKFTGLFNAYQTYAQNHSGSQQPFEKCSLGYTAYGDSADGASRVHSKEGSMYASSYNRVGGYFGGSMYKYCASLIKDMSDKGIHVYHAFAAMDKNSPDFAGDMTWINTYTEKLAAQFPGMTLVGDYKTSLVPTETLYDSEWHLIWDGAVQRTSKLVPELVSQMKEDGIIK